MSNNEQDPSLTLISFLKDYTGLLSDHLKSVRSVIGTTVSEIMDGVEQLHQTAESGRETAEKKMESTYLAPSAETQILVDDLQKHVSDIFEDAQKSMKQDSSGSAGEEEPLVVLQNRIKRLEGLFDDSNEKLKLVDDNIKSILFGLIGSLSTEDVISQRINHVINCLKALQTSMSYILLDYESRAQHPFVDQTIQDLKDYTFAQYSAEKEKNEFRLVFPDKKAS